MVTLCCATFMTPVLCHSGGPVWVTLMTLCGAPLMLVWCVTLMALCDAS